MHSYLYPLLLFLMLIGWSFPGDLSAQQEPATVLQDAYNQALRKIEREQDEEVKKTLKKYDGILQKLEAYYKKKSDLDSILAIRKEKSRLAAAQGLKESDRVDQPAKLAELQNQVYTRLLRIRKAFAEAVISTEKGFQAKGEALQEKLVKEDRITQAVEVKNVLDQLSRAVPYKKAIMTLKEYQEQTAPAAPPKRNGNSRSGTTSPASSMEKIFTGQGHATIYRKGSSAPQLGNKRESWIFTGRESRASSSRMQAMLYITNPNKKFPEDKPHDASWYSYEGEAVVPGLKLTAGPADCYGTTLYLQYFVKSGGSRIKARTEKIPLGDIEKGESLTVFGAGFIPTYVSRHHHSDGSSHTSYSSTGDPRGDYGGMIVSIFDRDGSMVFQRCTYNGLVEFARPQPPTD